MPGEALVAVVVFAAMFIIWAVIPSLLKKRHNARVEETMRQ